MGTRTMPEPTKGVIRVPKPPQDAVVVGTYKGHTVYEREIEEVVRDEKGRPIKDPVMEPDGKTPKWRKHATTGEALYPIVKTRKRRRTQRFILHIEANERGVATGNHRIVENFEEDPAHAARMEAASKARRFGEELFARAAERGIDPDQLLDSIAGPAGPGQGADSSSSRRKGKGPPAEPASYPEHLPVGRWILSDEHREAIESGESEPWRGKKDEAEKLVRDGFTLPPE